MSRENKIKKCLWEEDNDGWYTDCLHRWVFTTGTPKDNEMKFCCFCGKKLKQKKYKPPIS